MENSNQKMLMKRLQICDFVLIETSLFLDTHPEDQEALDYYKRYLQLQKETLADYVSKYGPIRHSDFSGGTRWTWVDNPWPWENVREA